MTVKHFPDFTNPESGWRTLPVRNLLRITKEEVGDNWDSTQLLSLTKQGVIERDIDSGKGKYPESFDGYQIVKPDDLVFCLFDVEETPRTVGLVKQHGMITSAYTRVILNRTLAHPSYVEYYFISLDNEKRFKPFYSGLRNTIQKETLKSTRMSLPPLEVQSKIVSYLALELSKIDSLISNTEKFQQILQERLDGRIFTIITGESVSSRKHYGEKFSNFDGVPDGWRIQKLSRLFTASKGSRGSELTVEYCGQNKGPYPVYSGQTEQEGVLGLIDSYEFDTGDEEYLFTTTVGAKAMTLRQVKGRFSLSQNCMIIRNLKPNVVATNFAYYFLSVVFAMKRNELSEHMQASFRMGDLYQMWLMFPKLEEQIQIVAEIEKEIDKVSMLMVKNEKLIELLHARKKMLISQSVMGHIGDSSHGYS